MPSLQLMGTWLILFPKWLAKMSLLKLEELEEMSILSIDLY